MAANAVDFAGTLCGCRYEKELETHFRDCLLFYIDGRIRFERYCYGEAACLVFSLWANGLDETGKIQSVKSVLLRESVKRKGWESRMNCR